MFTLYREMMLLEIITGILNGLKLFWRPFLIFSLVQLLIYMGVKENNYFQTKQAEGTMTQEGYSRKTIIHFSIILNWILTIELLSLNLIAVASIQANLMMGSFMFVGFGITYGLPLAVFFTIMLSIKHRKNNRVLLSLIIQIVAVFIAAVPIAFLLT